MSALAGFSVAGRQVAARIAEPGAWETLQAVSRAPDAVVGRPARDAARRPARDFPGCSSRLALLVPIVRGLRRAAGAKVEVTYRGGPIVRVPLGPTLLEISRMSSVPHASVCGGRARCSTCRVGVETGLARLMPPAGAEAVTLASIMAPPHVRLACQIRPREPITVTRLVAPPARAWARVATGHRQGIERNLAVLFLDTRGFTMISEKRLPYDVVFILNRLFAEVGEAIERHDGVIDKYLGDGLMALFGAADGADAGCRQALRAARDIDLALDRLNQRDHERDRHAPQDRHGDRRRAAGGGQHRPRRHGLGDRDRQHRQCREPARGAHQGEGLPADRRRPTCWRAPGIWRRCLPARGA